MKYKAGQLLHFEGRSGCVSGYYFSAHPFLVFADLPCGTWFFDEQQSKRKGMLHEIYNFEKISFDFRFLVLKTWTEKEFVTELFGQSTYREYQVSRLESHSECSILKILCPPGAGVGYVVISSQDPLEVVERKP